MHFLFGACGFQRHGDARSRVPADGGGSWEMFLSAGGGGCIASYECPPAVGTAPSLQPRPEGHAGRKLTRSEGI